MLLRFNQTVDTKPGLLGSSGNVMSFQSEAIVDTEEEARDFGSESWKMIASFMDGMQESSSKDV